MTDAVPAFKRLLEIFNRLGISYAVGGSLAKFGSRNPARYD